MTITTPDIDIGKNTFHLFGAYEKGSKVIRKKLSRKSLMAFVPALFPWRLVVVRIIWEEPSKVMDTRSS